jgi:hypothetical protein
MNIGKLRHQVRGEQAVETQDADGSIKDVATYSLSAGGLAAF